MVAAIIIMVLGAAAVTATAVVNDARYDVGYVYGFGVVGLGVLVLLHVVGLLQI